MPSVSFTGIASGIDGDAIIESLAESRRLATAPLQNNIAENEAETTSLEEFNTKLLGLNDALEEFLTLNGGALSKSSTTSNDQAVTATAVESAAEFSTTVDIINLARPATLSFNDRFSEIDTPLVPGLSGTDQLDISIGTGAEARNYPISLDNTTTLSDLAQSINESTEDNIQATVVNAGSASNPEYLLLVQGVETGVEKGELSINVGAGITGAGVFGAQTLEQAEDAVFNIAGIGQITRGQNTVADVFPGVTIDLKGEGLGPVNLSVSADADKTAEKMQRVVEAFNEIVTLSSDNSKVERVEEGERVVNIFGSLARTRLDEQAIGSIRTALSSSKSEIVGSEIQILADLGITTERDGKLAFDSDKFKEGVAKDSSSTEAILASFADTLATTDGVIAGYTQFGGLLDTAKDANAAENERMQDSIDRVERGIRTQSEALKLQYANLESTIGGLQSNGDALLSILSGLRS